MNCGPYLALCLLVLTGCADTSMQDAVSPLVGQNVRRIIERWGSPTSSGDAFGSTIYTWQVTDIHNGNCKVNVVAFRDGTIKSWNWQGVQGGTCGAMAAQLRTGIGFVGHEDLR